MMGMFSHKLYAYYCKSTYFRDWNVSCFGASVTIFIIYEIVVF